MCYIIFLLYFFYLTIYVNGAKPRLFFLGFETASFWVNAVVLSCICCHYI